MHASEFRLFGCGCARTLCSLQSGIVTEAKSLAGTLVGEAERDTI